MPLDTGSICPVNMRNLAENHCILMVTVFLHCSITLPRDFLLKNERNSEVVRSLYITLYNFLQDSTLYSCTEDYTGAIPHCMDFLLIRVPWKERRTFL